MDRLDVCTERIALVLRPDGLLAVPRYFGKPTAAWTGDHPANSGAGARLSPRYHFERDRFLLVYSSLGRADFMPACSKRSL